MQRSFAALVVTIIVFLLSAEHTFRGIEYRGPQAGLATVDFAPLGGPIPRISHNGRGREEVLAFVRRATMQLHLSTYACHPHEMQLSLLERLLVLGERQPSPFSDGLLTARLRCGYCHQIAHRLVVALQGAGIDAQVYGIGGHVIARITLDGVTYAADPQYGVGPFRWPSDPVQLRDNVIAAYADTVIFMSPADKHEMAERYITEADNAPYTGLAQKQERQERLFALANVLAWVLSALAIIAVIWSRKPAKRENEQETTATICP